MTDEFGKSGDAGQKDGFAADGSGEQSGLPSDATITPEDLTELRKRDVNAQTHIPQLQGENATLREQLADMQAKLDGSATLEEVINRIENRSADNGSSNTPVNADEVATQVEARLKLKAMENKQASNWNTVWGKLEELHGSEENIDKYVESHSASLGMTTDEATLLAKNSPDAFLRLFTAEGTAAPQQGVVSGNPQQTLTNAGASGTNDKAYYDEMLKKNPRKYWKTETQLQLRRDVYGET